MKYFTESVARCAARIGSITGLDGMPSVTFETPLLLIYTRRGSVPHLTKEVFQMVTDQQQFLTISLPSTAPMINSVKLVNSLSEFVAMKEYPFLMSIQDSAEATPRGYQKKNSIAVWTRGGKESFDPDSYMDLVEKCKPDLYVALCDGDTDENSSSKRVTKAIERSEKLFNKCLERHKSSNILRSKGLLGAVEGGYDIQAREASAKFLADKNVDGFVIDGLHINGPEVQNITFEKIKAPIERVMHFLPVEKMKVSMGCWNPAVVINLVEHGVDVFDSSYPYIITESGKALTFMCAFHGNSRGNLSHEIFIGDERFINDFSPICKLCECLTCKNHTRAYLNHLYNVKELLGSVLLMM